MQAIYQLLRKLTLPGNAGNGARIVLDGTTDAILIYDASNNLVESIAATAGVDPFGNQFPAGHSTYNRGAGVFTNLNGNQLTYGLIVAGQPSFTNAGYILQNNSNPMTLQSLIGGANNDAVNMSLGSGQGGQHTGSGLNPNVQLVDSALSTPVDFALSGNIIKTQNSGTAYTWQTPTAASGYTITTMQYRQLGEDAVLWIGEIVQTTGVGAAGAAVVTVAVPAVYRPTKNWEIAAAWLSTTSVAKGAAIIRVNSDGTLSLIWPAATANGDKFSFGATVPLNNIP